MAGKDLKAIESFRGKIAEAVKGENKAEGIKNAIMELLQAQGVSIPNLDSKLDFGPKKEYMKTNKESHTAIKSFTQKIHEAIQGENTAADIKKAVAELQQSYGIEHSKKEYETHKEIVSYKEPETYNEPESYKEPVYRTYATDTPIQKGVFTQNYKKRP
jgi:RecB family endonuclease NucS